MKEIINKSLDYLVQDFKKSNDYILIWSISYFMGLGFGSLGKYFEEPIIPIIPPALDLGQGHISPGLIPYAFGVATVYTPEIITSLELIK